MGPDLSTLVEWLDGRAGTDGEAYVTMHGRLVGYFARKGCRAPEELADETLSRVARRLEEEGGAITDVAPAQYCYIVARFVFLEHLRSPERSAEALPRDIADRSLRTDDAGRERLLSNLDACLGKLDPDDRALLLDYYAGAQPERIAVRRDLAIGLGLTANAIAIRACRLRERVRTCLASRLRG